jgi:N-acetylglucosaminyl-diphospho-decaprenol L-rhamnosyltransferase
VRLVVPPPPVEVSVVVVNFNTGRLLGECLASVRRFTGDVTLEVLVVDNASTDGSLDVLREYPEVQSLRNATNVGFARAVNQALAVAKGRFVLLLNPDTRIESPFFRQILAFAETHPGAGIVGPRLVNPDGTLQTSAYRFPTLVQAAGTILGLKRLVPVSWLRTWAGPSLRRYFGQLDPHVTPCQVDLVTGACMLVRRQVLDAIGGLDPRFFLYFEEKDYCRRARGVGFDIYFDPSVEVVHAIGGSSRGDPMITVVERCRSMRQYHDKHGGPATRLVLRGLFLGGGLARLAGALVAGDRRAVRAWWEVVTFAFRRRIDR